VAYQGYGRGLDLGMVHRVIDVAVGDTRPDLTLWLHVPLAVSETRRQARRAESGPQRDRMEEADRSFFERVEAGYRAIAAAEPNRVKMVDATQTVEQVRAAAWPHVERLLLRRTSSRP
jgi:dTMP kinase